VSWQEQVGSGKKAGLKARRESLEEMTAVGRKRENQAQEQFKPLAGFEAPRDSWVRWNFKNNEASYVVLNPDPDTERAVFVEVFRFLVELEGAN